jgi:hypothetical protein
LNFEEEQDPDPHESGSQIRIRIKVKRKILIRNLASAIHMSLVALI